MFAPLHFFKVSGCLLFYRHGISTMHPIMSNQQCQSTERKFALLMHFNGCVANNIIVIMLTYSLQKSVRANKLCNSVTAVQWFGYGFMIKRFGCN